MIDVREIGIREEIFTHIPDDGGPQITYAVTRMMLHCGLPDSGVEKFIVPVDEEHAKYCLAQRGVEQHRLDRLAEPWLWLPLLFIAQPDSSHLLADGTHRYVRLWQMGVKETAAFMMTWDQAQPFIVEGVPQMDPTELRDSWSGM